MSAEILQRIVAILEQVPVSSEKPLSTAEIYKRLQQKGEVTFTKRTLERYLVMLESEQQLLCFNEGRSNLWCRADKVVFSDARENAELALAYLLAEAPLQQNAPTVLLEKYHKRITLAHHLLAKDKLGVWQQKIVQVPGSFPPLAIEFEQQIKNTIYQALYEQSCLQVDYQAAEAEVKAIRLHPYGLINAGERKYLIATDTPELLASVRLFALQRFKSASLSRDELQIPDGLDLQTFGNQGLSGWRIQPEPVQVRLQAKGLALQQLQESTLTFKAQQLSDAVYQLEFITPLTYELIRWCIAMGNDIYLQGPDTLVAEIIALRQDPLQPFSSRNTD